MEGVRSIYRCIQTWKRRDAIASFKYDTLNKHGHENPKCYNRSTVSSIINTTRSLVSNFKNIYLRNKTPTKTGKPSKTKLHASAWLEKL